MHFELQEAMLNNKFHLWQFVQLLAEERCSTPAGHICGEACCSRYLALIFLQFCKLHVASTIRFVYTFPVVSGKHLKSPPEVVCVTIFYIFRIISHYFTHIAIANKTLSLWKTKWRSKRIILEQTGLILSQC